MKTRVLRLAAVLVLTGAVPALAQTKQWDKRFGGGGDDYLESVEITADGGYLLAGGSSSGLSGDRSQDSRGTDDYWIVKLNSAGGKQWDRRFGGAGYDYGVKALQTPDGGYLILGDTDSDISGDKTQASQGGYDLWLVKVDAAGNKQWDRRFGGAGNELAYAMRGTTDGGVILGGHSTSGAGGDKTEGSQGGVDYWIVKVDANGNKQWDRRFGGGDDDYLRDLQQTRDGGYILGGYSRSGAGGDKTEDSRGGEDYWIVKVDAAGNKQWDRRFGGSNQERLAAIRQTADGGYLLGGRSLSGADGDKTQASQGGSDYWVVKVDAAGTKQWDRRFGGMNQDVLTALVLTRDGGFIVGGYSSSEAGSQKTEGTRGGLDYWIVKLDAYGNRRWDRRFGGAGEDVLLEIQQMADGGYILGGYSRSGAEGDRTEASRGGDDYWIVKVAALPPDAYEFDDTRGTAKAIARGQTQARSIHEPRDVDWAKFVIGRHGASSVRVMTSGAAGDTEMWVYRGSTGAQAGYNDDRSAANRFSRVDLAALGAGTYFIKVQEKGNDAAIPAYTLRVNWVIQYAPDRYEPDNSRGAAKTIRNGQTQRRTIHRAGNRDWAKFTIGAGGARNLRVETRGSSGDTELFIYNAAGRRLAYDDNSGPGRFSRITAPAVPAGTYFIRVQEKGNDGTLAAYTLKASWTAQ